MLVNRGMFVTKTMEGRIIEGSIGIGLVVITLPILILSTVGSLCGRILDEVVELERNICKNLQGRGL